MASQTDTAELLNIEGFKGDIFEYGRRGYAVARQVFNMREDERNPALIIKPRDESDVALVMKRAAELKHPVGLRSGGHNVDGTAMHGSVVVDLRELRDTHVDKETNRITIGAGILLGDLDALGQEHGLVVPTGTVGTTGVVGLTLGGGVGFKMRELGATVDNLLRCRLVTTQGEIVTASETENSDLFWGLRGAGANLGVVTELEFQAHPFNPVANVGRLGFPTNQIVETLVKVSVWMEDAPREIGIVPAIVRPPLELGAPSRDPVLMIVVVTTGDPADFEQYIETIASFGSPLAKEIVQMPWTAANTLLEMGAPWGLRSHSRGGYVRKPREELFGNLLERAFTVPDPEPPGTFAIAGSYFSGAITEDFDEDSMAFSRENADYMLELVGMWSHRDEDSEGMDWLDGTIDSVRHLMLPNAYINLTCDSGLDWLHGVYGKPEKFERLIEIKTKWDPDNLLRFNRNIPTK